VKRTGCPIILATLAALGGCLPSRPAPLLQTGPQVDPLPVQQARAYPETVTGMFLPLVDFEDAPDGRRGDQQVENFTILPAGVGSRKFVVNVTRTGAGALEVALPPQAELAFAIPDVHDFTGYSLLSLALYSEALRDDLVVTLISGGGVWTSCRTLVSPGWNTVLFDIQRLEKIEGFDVADVREIRLTFADSAGPVTFNLDDVMIVDNRRSLEPVPPGVELKKTGLDYSLALGGYDLPIPLAVSGDGLWRLGPYQPVVQVAAPGEALPAEGEHLELMGERKIGAVDVLELNPVRIRLASTWYFPTRVGEWASLAVRQIRWEYTFYADGRWVTYVQLNNSGGREIGALRLRFPRPAAWAGGEVSPELLVRNLVGPVGRWSCLIAPARLQRQTLETNYIRPGRIRAAIAVEGFFAPGDSDRDGFDESQGCYALAARGGHCRFTILPPVGGLVDPFFRVAGRWEGPVSVNSEGLAVRNVVRLDDGSALFMVPGFIDRPTAVEVTGKVPLLAEE